ncbi:hypothetical protein EYC80_009151 [Monilinia laxa]|uniref:Hydrophobic surface binding protein n=1 Tax=Monilinia laxa TaxID=61186 RepID=A0A5N6K2L6_MONLA|nr:hypothetical protein EYC80_009151 [Monilinia laxa]
MVAMKNIILFISAVSATAIPKRTSTIILTDIGIIDRSVNALTIAVNDYEGEVFQLLTLNDAVGALDTAIKVAGTDANITSPLSSADSSLVYTATLNLVSPIQQSLAAVVAKKAEFAAAGLTTTVTGNVATLKKDTDTLSQNIYNIASSDVKPKLVVVQSEVDSAFTAAQAAL